MRNWNTFRFLTVLHPLQRMQVTAAETIYGTLIAWAEALGQNDIARFLMTDLKEETVADKELSTVALRRRVHRKAAS